MQRSLLALLLTMTACAGREEKESRGKKPDPYEVKKEENEPDVLSAPQWFQVAPDGVLIHQTEAGKISISRDFGRRWEAVTLPLGAKEAASNFAVSAQQTCAVVNKRVECVSGSSHVRIEGSDVDPENSGGLWKITKVAVDTRGHRVLLLARKARGPFVEVFDYAVAYKQRVGNPWTIVPAPPSKAMGIPELIIGPTGEINHFFKLEYERFHTLETASGTWRKILAPASKEKGYDFWSGTLLKDGTLAVQSEMDLMGRIFLRDASGKEEFRPLSFPFPTMSSKRHVALHDGSADFRGGFVAVNVAPEGQAEEYVIGRLNAPEVRKTTGHLKVEGDLFSFRVSEHGALQAIDRVEHSKKKVEYRGLESSDGGKSWEEVFRITVPGGERIH